MSAVAAQNDEQTAPPVEPDPQDLDSSPTSDVRGYVVLEEYPDLRSLVVALMQDEGLEPANHISPEGLGALADVAVYRKLGVFEARNSEHALRKAAKASYSDSTGGAFELVSVSEKMWRPQTVRVRATQTVAIG